MEVIITFAVHRDIYQFQGILPVQMVTAAAQTTLCLTHPLLRRLADGSSDLAVVTTPIRGSLP